MGKKIAILLAVLLVLVFGAQFVVKKMVGSTYRSLPFQKVVKDGFEYALNSLGIPAEVRLKGVNADGWDCTIRAVSITMKNKSADVFEITNVRMSPEVWDAVFGGKVVAKLSGLLDGQQGKADITVTPGLLDMAGGDQPVLTDINGSVAGLGKRWISDFLFSSQPASPRVRFKDGTLDVKGRMSGRGGELTLKIAKPIWVVKVRGNREIIGEDIQVNLQLAKSSVRLASPAVLKAKPGSISVQGSIATGGKQPSANLQVTTKGSRMVSIMAAQLFKCGRPMPPRFAVSGPMQKLKCR